MKYLLMVLSILISGLSFQSCDQNIGEITNVKKSAVFPGVEHGNFYYKYTAAVHLNKPVFVDSVIITNEKNTLQLAKFSLIKKSDGQIINTDKEIPKGDYYFSAEVLKMPDLEQTNDKLVVQVHYHNNEYILSKPVEDSKPIMYK